jgi:hypothetical protein
MSGPRELAREAWSEYLDALSRELLNAPVSIEITEGAGPTMIEDDRLALQNLLYDRDEDVFLLAAARGGERTPSVVRHLVDQPRRVAVDTEAMLAPLTLSVDGGDGARTIIRVAREADISGG